MRNYSFRARAPIVNADLVKTQLRLGFNYQTMLVAIEQRRRQVVDRLYQRACPMEYAAVVSTEQALSEAVAVLRRVRSKQAVLSPPGDTDARSEVGEAKKALAPLREAFTSAVKAFAQARARATLRLKKRLAWCDRGARARAKVAYGQAGVAGLAWGTRLKVGESAERGAQAAAKVGSLPRVPRMEVGDDGCDRVDGQVAVQLQNGLSVEGAFSMEDTRLRIEVVSVAEWQRRQGRSHLVGRNGKSLDQPAERNTFFRRGVRLAFAHLRVGSVDRRPVFAVWPVVLGRSLPEGALIKWAMMHLSWVGARPRWQLLLTVEEGEIPVRGDGLTLAVNFGWRNLPDGGIRVAYAVGDDGFEEEVRVPLSFVEKILHAERVGGMRTRLFNEARGALEEWLADCGKDVPAWFAEATRYVALWRSPVAIVRLLREWSGKRFDGDEAIFRALTLWEGRERAEDGKSRGNRHLRFWESDEHRKARKARKDFYRQVAARWASRYARILVTDVDFRDFARQPLAEEGDHTDGALQRRTRMLASPSELREAVKNACSTREASFEEIRGPHTQTCLGCGLVAPFDAARDLIAKCFGCGLEEDQDRRHCRSLLARGRVLRERAEPLAPSTSSSTASTIAVRGGRWARRRSQKRA